MRLRALTLRALPALPSRCVRAARNLREQLVEAARQLRHDGLRVLEPPGALPYVRDDALLELGRPLLGLDQGHQRPEDLMGRWGRGGGSGYCHARDTVKMYTLQCSSDLNE